MTPRERAEAGFWEWFLSLPNWMRTVAVLGGAFSLGLAAASAFAQQSRLPARVDRLEVQVELHAQRLNDLETNYMTLVRFAGCLLSEQAEHRDVAACRYILPSPQAFEPPRR